MKEEARLEARLDCTTSDIKSIILLCLELPLVGMEERERNADSAKRCLQMPDNCGALELLQEVSMYNSVDKMYKTWEQMQIDLWEDDFEETKELMRTGLEKENPSSFFEGVAVAFPICLFLWFLIYLGIRQIFF
jgi:hypothetical protein